MAIHNRRNAYFDTLTPEDLVEKQNFSEMGDSITLICRRGDNEQLVDFSHDGTLPRLRELIVLIKKILNNDSLVDEVMIRRFVPSHFDVLTIKKRETPTLDFVEQVKDVVL